MFGYITPLYNELKLGDYYYFKMMLLYYFIVMTFGAIIMDNIPIVCILTYVIYIKSLQNNGIETK